MPPSPIVMSIPYHKGHSYQHLPPATIFRSSIWAAETETSSSGKLEMPAASTVFFREVVKTYVTMVHEVGFRIEEAISESLGLDPKCIKNMMGEQGQHIMAVNYYPPCPQPELTYGLPAHTDPNTLTILLQDSHVAGLQVLKEGKWLTIKPRPDAFVINIGDQLQALSNGKYKSVWHRAIVNTDRARVSVASFLCPENDAVISAPESLTQDGSTAVYRKFTYQEYYSKFSSGALKQQHSLELFKN